MFYSCTAKGWVWPSTTAAGSRKQRNVSRGKSCDFYDLSYAVGFILEVTKKVASAPREPDEVYMNEFPL
jgi:hypothetical protein